MTEATRVLIVDDEASIARVVRDELVFEGFAVQLAADGPTGLRMAHEFRPAVVLLDVMLPGMNGFDVCRELRREATTKVWIIMLTVRGEEVDRVRGLETGADDYVTKPFSLKELVARVKVGVRHGAEQRTAPLATARFGDVEIDIRGHRVLKRGREVALTRKEFQMLALLVRRPGEVISREEFLDTVWGRDVNVMPRTVDTHMATLRRKLELEAESPRYLIGVRGVGYRFDADLTER